MSIDSTRHARTPQIRLADNHVLQADQNSLLLVTEPSVKSSTFAQQRHAPLVYRFEYIVWDTREEVECLREARAPD